MMNAAADKVLSAILKHDSKLTSYKIALLRAINDLVLLFPDAQAEDRDVAVPLRMLADFWIAYHWPFADKAAPVLQGPRIFRDGVLRQDISFRVSLEDLRAQWQTLFSTKALPSDGFFLISEFRTPRRRELLPPELRRSYTVTVTKICDAINQPIRYAGGPEQYTVFDKPQRLRELPQDVYALPGADAGDVCLVVKATLWRAFHDLSLWIEALCIHEWSLFSERTAQEAGERVDRGSIYFALTARPGNRRPLTWERNQIDLLLMEGVPFICPWTGKPIVQAGLHDLDHLLPLSLYPINEMWNLLPADTAFNQHVKRARVPSAGRLAQAQPRIAAAYENYEKSQVLSKVMREDAVTRFAGVAPGTSFALSLSKRTVCFIEEVAAARSAVRF